MKETLTMEEAAVYLGVNWRTVFNYRKRGSLKSDPNDKKMVTRESVLQVKEALDLLKGNVEESEAA